MGGKLSHQLLDLGFLSALGTSEHPGMAKKEVHVKRGRPNTYDYNNGVTVVYDEKGRPWIFSGHAEDAGEGFEQTVREHNLERGAYVPHSNDGGFFVRMVMPRL